MKITIDPAVAAGGDPGWYRSIPVPAPEKCCGKCQQPRDSVDDRGTCGYCRAIEKAKRTPGEEVPFPEEG